MAAPRQRSDTSCFADAGAATSPWGGWSGQPRDPVALLVREERGWQWIAGSSDARGSRSARGGVGFDACSHLGSTAPSAQTAAWYNSSVERELAAGTVVAGFRIERILGAGGMGVVYLAIDAALDRRVALKVMSPELAADDGYRDRFLTEAKLAASLEHAAIVPIYAAGESDGQLFLAMRLIEGGSLARRLAARGRLDPTETRQILAPIADALDRAHARGLVHRDVKPGNVLLEDDRSYLADFGLARSAGSVDSGGGRDEARLSGTIGYMAPEQIEGDPVTARTDLYALACTLYECLTGQRPFARDSEVAMIYAHLSERPPSVVTLRPELPRALDGVIAQGLAKRPEDRYRSGRELVEAFAAACNLGAPATTTSMRRRWRTRRTAAGAVAAVALAAGAAVIVSERGSGTGPASEAQSTTAGADPVAVIDAASGRVVRRVAAGSAPVAATAGAGAVWVLNADDQTVTKFDATSHAPLKTFSVSAAPSDLALGAGALWVTTGVGTKTAYAGGVVDSVTRVDVTSNSVVTRIPVPQAAGGLTRPSARGQIAVGSGAVWIVAADGSIARIDPARNVVSKVIPGVAATQVAVGAGAVWALGGDRLWRIDPTTGGVSAPIALQTAGSTGLAVGGGAVWVADPWRGLVVRVDPGPPVLTSTIPTAPGAGGLTFASNRLWVVNSLGGTVLSVDPSTNRVDRTIAVEGAPQAVAATDDALWVPALGAAAHAATASTAPEDGDVQTAACGKVFRDAASRPDVLITSDLPLQGEAGRLTLPMTDAIRVVLQERHFRAGRFTVGYQSCDDGSTSGATVTQCNINAEAYASTARVVGIIGPYDSFCAVVEVPVLSRAPGGAVPLISPINTDPGLTTFRDLSPAGVQSYAGVVAPNTLQAAADAVLAKQLSVHRPFILSAGDLDVRLGTGVAETFAQATRRLGGTVAGLGRWDAWATTRDLDRLAAAAAQARSDGVFLIALPNAATGSLLKALRRRLGPRVPLITIDPLQPVDDYVRHAGAAATGMYVSTLVPTTDRLSESGRKWARRFSATQVGGAVTPLALLAAHATEALLAAIAGSDGTRASITRALLQSDLPADSILGGLHLTARGEIRPAAVTILRITRSTQASSHSLSNYEGAAVDRTLLPSDLGAAAAATSGSAVKLETVFHYKPCNHVPSPGLPCAEHGTFSSGNEVTTRLLCRSGTVTRRHWQLEGGIYFSDSVELHYRCADGSVLHTHGQTVTSTPNATGDVRHRVATWTIVGGTGRLAGLHGWGDSAEVDDQTANLYTDKALVEGLVQES